MSDLSLELRREAAQLHYAIEAAEDPEERLSLEGKRLGYLQAAKRLETAHRQAHGDEGRDGTMVEIPRETAETLLEAADWTLVEVANGRHYGWDRDETEENAAELADARDEVREAIDG